MVILCDIRLPEFDKLPAPTEGDVEQKTNPWKLPAPTEGAAEQKTNPRKLPATTEGADKKQILKN